jgi:hypothetical protein
MNKIKTRVAEAFQTGMFDEELIEKRIGMPIPVLMQVLDNRNIELRTLETLSKELRIPLYSLFQDATIYDLEAGQINHYINRETRTEIDNLLVENNKLKKQVEELKELLLLCKTTYNEQ